MIEINLPNKERLILVEVPEDANGFEVHQIILWELGWVAENCRILGCFYPSRNEIDFEVKEGWVGKQLSFGKYRHYAIEGTSLAQYGSYMLYTAKESFLSLLKSHLPDNEYVNKKYLVLIQK